MIIFKDVLRSMSGFASLVMQELNDTQLASLGGGMILRIESAKYLDNLKDSLKPSLALKKIFFEEALSQNEH
jgi:hypothetical protein